MSDKIKVLITADTANVAGRFADRGEVIWVAPHVAQALFNERQATKNPEAITARESELANACAGGEPGEAASAAPVAETASAAPAVEKKTRVRKA